MPLNWIDERERKYEIYDPVIWTLHEGHDSSITEFNYKTGESKTLELEKILESKHAFLSRGDTIDKYTGNAWQQACAQTKKGNTRVTFEEFKLTSKSSEISNYNANLKQIVDHMDIAGFSQRPMCLYYKGNSGGATEDAMTHLVNVPYFTFYLSDRGYEPAECRVLSGVSDPHHMLHCLSGYYQSPFENAFCLSYDGGGDTSSMSEMTVRDSKIGHYLEHHSWTAISQVFKYVGHHCYGYISPNSEEDIFDKKGKKITQGTYSQTLDYAGKVMGLSSYGVGQFTRKESYIDFYKMMITSLKGQWRQRVGAIAFDDRMLNPAKFVDNHPINYDRPGGRGRRITVWSKEEEILHAWSCQTAAEEVTVEWLNEPRQKKLIREHDNNVVLSGGGALNVLVNEAVKKHCGYNVYVPPDPGDQGLAYGLAVYRAQKDWGFKPWKASRRPNVTISALQFDDSIFSKHLKWWNAERTDIPTVARLLEKGDILGFIQGNAEKGPRALGNRSILCDPSFQDARNRINKNIKNREWYRPFAPVCRKEDAELHFESPSFDRLEHMSFVVDVKEESKSKYPSIVAADGTARLQTVTPQSNGILYHLLTEFSGDVLLNTSFNVQGKPTLNKLDVALEILQETDLNHVVYYRNGVFWLFSSDKRSKT